MGGGMQNGRWQHRDNTVEVGVGYNWDEGGHPNSAPVYVSSAGYGVFRNTWSPGVYSFHDTVTSVHDEGTRFDAYLMVTGGSIKDTISAYVLV